MRFRVEVEVSEAELPAATELLSVIRLLTEHVKSSQLVINGVAATTASAVTGHAAPLPLPTPAVAAAAAAAPATVAAAAPAAAAGLPPLRDQLHAILARVAPDGANADQIGAELTAVLAAAYQQHPNTEAFVKHVADEYSDAFVAAAFDPALLATRRGSSAFVVAVSKVGEEFNKVASHRMVHKTLKQLTLKRAEDAPRESFSLQSEAFGMLAAVGLVAKFDGALQSMDRIMQKPENRAAAVDTLCRIVQLAEPKLAAGGALPTTVAALLNTLEPIGADPRYASEAAFIKAKLQPLLGPAAPAGAPLAAPPAAAAAALPPATLQLQPGGQLPLATGSIYAVAWEPTKQQLIVAGKDTPLVVWGSNNQAIYQFPHDSLYICAIDVMPQHSLALASLTGVGVSPDTAQPTAVQVFNTNAWGPRATINRPNTMMLPCLKALSDGNTFVTGESLRTQQANVFQEAVCAYDLASALSAGINAQPVRTWTEHSDLVSCLAAIPGQPTLFVSGSRDTTIKLWDTRQAQSAGALIHSTQSGTAAAHGQMVSCIDASGPGAIPMLVSSGLDGTVAAWDMRMLGQSAVVIPLMAVDGQPVLKVALADSPFPNLVAVATTVGIYALDVRPSGDNEAKVAHVTSAGLYEDITQRQFNDIRWGSHAGRPALFAACSDRPRVDALVATW